MEKVKYGAARAMYQLTGNEQYAEILVKALQTGNLQVRQSVLMDLGTLNYLDSAEAIAQTPVANSLKLIALKGLLENYLKTQPLEELTQESIRIMTLMDELL